MTIISTKDYWNAIQYGGTYRPEVCARCNLRDTHLCTRTGCDITPLEAVIELNGGRMPNLPKKDVDLLDCPIPAENDAADDAQRWNERRGR